MLLTLQPAPGQAPPESGTHGPSFLQGTVHVQLGSASVVTARVALGDAEMGLNLDVLKNVREFVGGVVTDALPSAGIAVACAAGEDASRRAGMYYSAR
jgi:hypothetical protein